MVGVQSDSPALGLPTTHLRLDHFRSLSGGRLLPGLEEGGVGEAEQMLSCHPNFHSTPSTVTEREKQFPVLILPKPGGLH